LYNFDVADVLPPNNIEAEEAVLGSLMIDPSAVPRVATFLRAPDFYVVKNGWIYTALQACGQEADLLTVSAELARQNLLDEVGGEGYLTQLMAGVPTALNVEAYAHLVEDMALRRRMLHAASDVAKIAFDTTKPIQQVIEQSEATIFEVSEQRATGQMVPMKKAVDEFFTRVEYLHEHRDEPIGIPTGFHELDRLLGGLQRGDLLIVAARPGVGKTSLMLNLGYNASFRHRQRVAIFSLEMSNEQLVQRFVSTETGIESQRLRTGQLGDEEWGRMSQVCLAMSEMPMYLDDTPSLSPLDLRVKARRIYQEHGLDLIIVDYLQLMQGEANDKGIRSENRVQEISYISRSLKQIARELKVPLIAGSQLSRVVEQRSDKRPMLSDLRESGSIEQDADIVSFIYRDDMYNPDTELKNIAEIIISKNRNGPTGKVDLFFDKSLTAFRNLSRERVSI
jgi:replicative DNA helicase